jgi:hypothetical protein
MTRADLDRVLDPRHMIGIDSTDSNRKQSTPVTSAATDRARRG